MNETINGLCEFIKNSPTAFHAVNTISDILEENGFKKINESDKWLLSPGGKYYCTRNLSSIIAFSVGESIDIPSFHITASHTDSPSFKLKENTEMGVNGKYLKLNIEGYGAMNCSSWLDRPLSIAGRIMLQKEDKIETRLLDFKRELALIPSLAIHMDRTVNDGRAYNKQIDMLPLIGGETCTDGILKELIAETLGVSGSDVLGFDLYLYNLMAPTVWGLNNEFISAPRLDDLQCAFASLSGFIRGNNTKSINVFCSFDNEEVGSGTKQGAIGTFLYDVLTRIASGLGLSHEDYIRALSQSFMLSCDNAHAVHPNFPDKSDKTNAPYLNGGIVLKSHAGQKYTSDAPGMALFRAICCKAGVPVQPFANRSDMIGGSTLGNLAMAQVSINAVDIGLPQLAMHSAYETAGAKDTEYLIRATDSFYSSIIFSDADGSFILR